MIRHELEAIATLAGHPGFKALMKLLDEADTELINRLESSPADKTEEILPLWRASRRIRRLLTDRPDTLLQELGAFLGDNLA